MENKKTLWIIAATGAFLLVVLGGAMVMWSQNSNTSTYAHISPVEKPLNGYQNPQNDFVPAPIPDQLVTSQDFNSPDVNGIFVVADGQNPYNSAADSRTTIDLNSLKNTSAEAEKTQNINVTVTFADEQKAGAELKKIIDKAPASNTSVKPKAAAPSKPVAVKKAEPKKAAPAAAVKTPVVTKFWVQVAAYSNKKGAEGARSSLNANKIEADIFTYKDNKENLFYRVRVGPYTTKSEAEYWRQKISNISEFSKAQSYVTSTES